MSNSAYSDLKAAYHLDKIDEIRHGIQIVPAQVQLILSDLCNQDCHFCLADGTMIDTIAGRRNISGIKPGDLVWGPDGTLQKVTATGSRLVQETYFIRIGEESIEASGDHPILTESGWLPARDVISGTGAVVRVRVREGREDSPGDVELVRRFASAKAWGFDRELSQGIGAHEGRQSYEAHGGPGEGVGIHSWEASAKITARTPEYIECCAAPNAIGPQSDARSTYSPSGHGKDFVTATVQDRAWISGMGSKGGTASHPDWPRIVLDRETQSRLQGGRTEEVPGVDAERMLHRLPEVSGLDELRGTHHSSLQEKEVGVFGGFREGSTSLPSGFDPDNQGLRIDGIQLERGLAVRQVDSVLRIPRSTIVYNFTCEPGNAYEANGIVVHNCAYRMSGGFSSEQFAGEGGEKNPNRKIPTKKAIEIIDDCATLGVKAIQFTGGGEPTVHPDHLLLFEYAQNLGLETSLVTNGILFRPGWELVLPKMKWVRVSIDAGNPEEYAKVRRVKPEFYAQAMSHIAMLAAEIEKQGTDCVLGVGYVITRENWADAYEGCLRIRETGAANIRLSAMFSTEGADYYEGVYVGIKAEIERIKGLARPGFDVIDLFGDRIADLVQHAPDYDFCGYQQFNMYIGGNLRVYRCCTTAYTKHGEVGDLTNQRLASWFYSDQKKSAYANFNARTCQTCQFNSKNRAIAYLTQNEPIHVNFV